MAETKSGSLELKFGKFHRIKITDHLRVSFAVVYLGKEETAKALEQLPHSWPREMIHYQPRRQLLKVYQPVVIADDSLLFFALRQSGESFCEVTFHRKARGKKTREAKDIKIACLRLRDHIRNDTRELVEVEGKPFGFGLPHPWKTDFECHPDYLRLVEHRPGSDATWPGFEPVWMKILDSQNQGPRYFRFSLHWDPEGVVLGVLAEELSQSSGEVPKNLKSLVL